MSEDRNASGSSWIVLTCVAATLAGTLFVFFEGGGLSDGDLWAEDYAGETAITAPPLLVGH